MDGHGGGGGGATRGRWRLAVVLLLALSLAACGEEDDGDGNNPGSEQNEAVEAIQDVGTPVGQAQQGGLPQDAESTQVTIANGALAPSDIEGQVGVSYVLVVTGDGSPHTLAIDGIVTETPINAQGETEVAFTVPERGTGAVPILLDGEEAGQFTVQGAGGATGLE